MKWHESSDTCMEGRCITGTDRNELMRCGFGKLLLLLLENTVTLRVGAQSGHDKIDATTRVYLGVSSWRYLWECHRDHRSASFRISPNRLHSLCISIAPAPETASSTIPLSLLAPRCASISSLQSSLRWRLSPPIPARCRALLLALQRALRLSPRGGPSARGLYARVRVHARVAVDRGWTCRGRSIHRPRCLGWARTYRPSCISSCRCWRSG